MNKLFTLIALFVFFAVGFATAEMTITLPTAAPQWNELIPITFAFVDSVPPSFTQGTAFSIQVDKRDLIAPLSEFAYGGPKDQAPCFDAEKVRFGSVTSIQDRPAQSATEITFTFDSVPELSTIVTCYLRIAQKGDISDPSSFSSTLPGTSPASLPAPVSTLIDAATITATISSGATSNTLPSFLSEYDLSEINLSYKSLPKNSLLPVQFRFLDIAQGSSPTIVKALDDELLNITTALLKYATGNADPKCSDHVRLLSLTPEGLTSPSLFILTGEAPVDGSCSIPFSTKGLGVLGFAIATQYIIEPKEDGEAPSETFDLQKWFQNSVKVQVVVGGKAAEVTVGIPDMNASSSGSVSEDGTLVVSGYAPAESEFEVTGAQGISVDSLIAGAKGFYASFLDFINSDSKPMVVQDGVVVAPTSIIDNIIDLAAGLKVKLSKLTASGYARVEVKFPELKTLKQPVTIEYKFLGQSFAAAYRPPVVIDTAGTKITSVSDTEMKYTVAFKMVAGQFDSTLPTPVEYALAISYPLREYRSSLYPFPVCTSSNDSITFETGSLSPTGLDTHFNSFLRMTSPNIVIADKWTIECTQNLLPGPKYSKPQEKVLQLHIENRFRYTELYAAAQAALKVNDVALVYQLSLPTTLGWTALATTTSTSMMYIYSNAVSAQADVDTIIKNAVTLLTTTAYFGSTNPFKDLKETDLRWVVDSAPTDVRKTQDQYNGSELISLKTNTFTNQYLVSIAAQGSSFAVGFAESFTGTPPGTQFNLYDPANNIRIYHLPTKVVIDNQVKSMTILGGKLDDLYYPGLQAAAGGACFSSTDCPLGYCYNGQCLHNYQLPSEVYGFVDTNPFLATTSTGISRYFSESNSASTAALSMVVFAVVCILGLLF